MITQGTLTEHKAVDQSGFYIYLTHPFPVPELQLLVHITTSGLIWQVSLRTGATNSTNAVSMIPIQLSGNKVLPDGHFRYKGLTDRKEHGSAFLTNRKSSRKLRTEEKHQRKGKWNH